jgi:hypothetical protein
MNRNNTGSESISIYSIMFSDMKTAKETQCMQEIYRTMIENKVGSTIILEDSTFNTEGNRSRDIVTGRDIVLNPKMLDIITDKDMFGAISKNQVLMSNFVSDRILVDQQSIYGKFTDYWFRNNMYG